MDGVLSEFGTRDIEPRVPSEDLSDRFSRTSSRLTNSEGVAYRRFRASLKPRYWQVWRDIAVGYCALLGIAAALIWVSSMKPAWPVLVVAALLGSAGFGYTHQSLSLYAHEAAHFNIAPSRKWNDILANLFLGVLQGFKIQIYRAKHFAHHRNLGQPSDTEHHYFQPLSLGFIIMTLSGARTAVELLRMVAVSKGPHAKAATEAVARYRLNWVLLSGAALHGGLVLGAAVLHQWVFCIAWSLGFLVWFPFFSMLRQILEHRDLRADPGADFTRVPHGALTRMFGDGPLACTFGAAGFNRHLLHHWEPQISCTRFKELEQFLLDTPVGGVIESRRSTYATVFVALLFGK